MRYVRTVTVGVILFVMAGAFAKARSFRVSKVSCTHEGLRIVVESDWPDGSEINLCITDDPDGFNCISETKNVIIKRARLVIDFANDENWEPFRPGRYWISIARGLDALPRVAVLPITIPKQ
jgi:hypothetical protein